MLSLTRTARHRLYPRLKPVRHPAKRKLLGARANHTPVQANRLPHTFHQSLNARLLRHENAAPAMLDDLRGAASVVCHHRRAARQRFNDGVPKSLDPVRRNQRGTRASISPLQFHRSQKPVVNNLRPGIARHRLPIRIVLNLAANIQRHVQRASHRDGVLQTLLRRDTSGPTQSIPRLRIVLENRGVHASIQHLDPLAFEERKRPGLRACIHGQVQPTLPPTLFDDPIHLIHGGTDGDPMSDRRAEERSQVKRQPVITNTYDYVVMALQPERLVPHVLQNAACPRHGDCTSLRAGGAGTHLARDLVQRDPRHRHHAAGRSHKAHPVPPSNEYRSEIEQVGFDAAGFTRPDGAYGRCDDQNAAGAQAFLYAESAAKSKPDCRKSRIRVHPRPSAAILVLLVETFGSPAARRFTQPASTLPMIETDAQLRTNCRLRPRQMSCNLLLNKEVTRNWLRLSNSHPSPWGGRPRLQRVSRPALSRTRALQ